MDTLQTDEQFLCCIHGIDLKPNEYEDFQSYFGGELNTTVTVENVVHRSDGGIDVLFWIPVEDIVKVALPRLQFGIRWWEDVVSEINDNRKYYSEEILAKYPPTI